MTKKEIVSRFIVGIIVFGPIYASGMYFFSDTGFSWFETIFVSVLWSAGMVVFEYFWNRIEFNKRQSS